MSYCLFIIANILLGTPSWFYWKEVVVVLHLCDNALIGIVIIISSTSFFRASVLPQSLVLYQTPFIDIPNLDVIVGLIALGLVVNFKFLAEYAPCFCFQHTF